MKQKFKNTQKGITLVALVITIIVLLILAMVSIKIVVDGGLITKASKATDTHTIGAEKEKITLGYNEYTLSKASGESVTAPTVEGAASVTGDETAGWTITFAHSDGDHVYTLSSDGTVEGPTNGSSTTAITWTKTDEGITSSTGITVQIGDYVNYDEGTRGKHTPDTSKGAGTSKTGGSQSTGYTLGTTTLSAESLNWRVLGVNDKGQLELISDNPTTQELYLANEEGWLNAEENLDTFCDELYGKGANASGARSLKVEDVDTLANYDKTTYSGYGVEWQWRFSDANSYVQYSTDGGTNWKNNRDNYTQFKYPGEAVINSSNPGTRAVKYTHYLYSAQDKIASNMSTYIANMITKGTTSSNINQWLSSRCVYCGTDRANFSIRVLRYGDVSSNTLFSSDVLSIDYSYRVRPVVSLKSNISLDAGSNTSHTTSATAWTING